MAEIGLLASIVQVADIGLRLSLRLYAFGETVASADRSISAISTDVSLTSSVLKELGDLLKSDTSRIYSDNAVKTADAVVRECSKAFTEMDEMLLKKVPQLHTGDSAKQSRASLILERLRWPAIKGKIELLRVNLDRMKSTLTLMLNVIIYAKQVSERKESPSVLSDQRQLIEDLAKANQDREREFNELRLALEGTHIDQRKPVTSSKSPLASTTSFVALPQMMSQSAEIPAVRKRRFLDRTSPSAYEAPSKTGPAVRLLVDEFTKLHSRLLAEVRSTYYQIGNESRVRYESDLTSSHSREIQVAYRSEPVPVFSMASAHAMKFQKTSKEDSLHVGAHNDFGLYDHAQATDAARLPQKMMVNPTNTSDLLPPNFRGQGNSSMDFSGLSNLPYQASNRQYGPPVLPQYNMDIQNGLPAPPQSAGGKRKRNAPASYRFRQLRKKREQEATNDMTSLEQKAKDSVDEGDSYRWKRDASQNALIRDGPSLSLSSPTPAERREELHQYQRDSETSNIRIEQFPSEAHADQPLQAETRVTRQALLRAKVGREESQASPEATMSTILARPSLPKENRIFYSSIPHAQYLQPPGKKRGRPCKTGAAVQSARRVSEAQATSEGSLQPKSGNPGNNIAEEGRKTSVTEETPPAEKGKKTPVTEDQSHSENSFSAPRSRSLSHDLGSEHGSLLGADYSPSRSAKKRYGLNPNEEDRYPFSAGFQTPNRTFSGSTNSMSVTGVTPTMSAAPVFPFFAPSPTEDIQPQPPVAEYNPHESSQTLPSIGELVGPYSLSSLPSLVIEKRLPRRRPHSPSYRASASFDGQVASHEGRQAVGTSHALRPSKDTMTVDSLISKWTNLVSSSPEIALQV